MGVLTQTFTRLDKSAQNTQKYQEFGMKIFYFFSLKVQPNKKELKKPDMIDLNRFLFIFVIDLFHNNNNWLK